ncbi:coenzyme F420-0:L-glutamate ligase [Candidatus Parcubacteria bacterium]|nr:coenzyme F420-0:L-glutamate ligase [Patescibacteria group bacterium]MBU4481828.1 coenzyme F420-0:L-glutamate ligase [Patescibacteria group bacterium]MCG2686908.1 coenzyme F420-0:L-glutamate ligase [Candidatus Parcubacteria bacterium]
MKRKKLTQKEIDEKNAGLSGAEKGFVVLPEDVEQQIRQIRKKLKKEYGSIVNSWSEDEVLAYGCGFPDETIFS